MTDDPDRETQAMVKLESAFRDSRKAMIKAAYGVLKDHDAAEDACQQVFTKLLTSLSKCTKLPTLTTKYLVAAARNTAIGFLRTQKRAARYAKSQDLIASLYNTDSTPSGLDDIRTRVIDTRLASLNGRQKEIVSRWRKSLPYSEIAAQLRISGKSVSSYLERAKKLLRKLAERERGRERGLDPAAMAAVSSVVP